MKYFKICPNARPTSREEGIMRRGLLSAMMLLLTLVAVQAFGQTWVTNTGFAGIRFR